MTKLVCMFHDYAITPKNATKNVFYEGMKWYKINSAVSFCDYNNEPISMKKRNFLIN